ncbi:hypothetical protein B0H14DRAFT_1239031 [Mycena olivaceomarginata]|nr:hypothetical protein B0H14DRAFT_1239031 [Mycena olivaceomarginata]
MANLAVTYKDLGKYQEAKPLEAIVLEKRKLLLGADHPYTLRAIAKFGCHIQRAWKYQEAESSSSHCSREAKIAAWCRPSLHIESHGKFGCHI